MRTSIALIILVAIQTTPTAVTGQDTVRFTPTVGYPTFAVREPVLRITPPTVLISETNFGGWYTAAGGDFPGESHFIEGKSGTFVRMAVPVAGGV